MPISFRKGTNQDVETVIVFLDEIRTGMPNKKWFYLDPPDLVREMMADGTMELWLAMDGDKTAAVFSVLHPGLESCN